MHVKNTQKQVAIDVNAIIIKQDSDTEEIVNGGGFKSLMQDQEMRCIMS